MKYTKLLAFICFTLLTSKSIHAQDPRLINWWLNTTNNKYNGILTDVEAVYYNTNNVYVKTSGLPNYYLDGVSVNNGKDLKATWVVPRNPIPATTPQGIMGGQNGLMIDGSVSFHPGDARSYNNLGVWNQLAYYFEKPDMDISNGHSTPNNMYHHHFNNLKVHVTSDSTKHSPIVGFAWDGYPIYGPYGYKNADGSGGLIRNTTSYVKKTYTIRTNGPNVSTTFPIGCYIEDWQYTSGAGTLDEHNGRFVITPDYPTGTYAYFTTVDANLDPIYPYFIGPTFYGTLTNTNIGPNGGTATIPGDAVLYTPTANVDIEILSAQITIGPNPTQGQVNFTFAKQGKYTIRIHNSSGALLRTENATSNTSLNISNLAQGIYIINVQDEINNSGIVKRIIKS
jgi:YHYH protein/Secretion system C-terminal sorting domain